MTDTLTFLQETSPFDLLPEEELKELVSEIKEIQFTRRTSLYEQHKTPLQGLDIIYKGSYDTFFYNSSGKKEGLSKAEAHQTYGAFSILLNKEKSIYSVGVSKGTTVLRIPSHRFKSLCKTYPDFYQTFLSAFGREMLNDTFATYVTRHKVDLDSFTFDRYFVRRLDTVDTREIICMHADTPCHDIAREMEANKISCLFLKENEDIVGFITDIILRNKIVAGQRHSATPGREIMEGPIYRISKQAFVYEAIILMFSNKIRYLIVEEDGQDVGLISRTKLLSDQAQSPFVFIQSVRLADTTEELKKKWSEVPSIVYNLLNRGVKSELVNQVITNISDSISLKVIERVIREIGEPPAKFVFMSLGSEGRMEQTLKTDQDNAIIYEDKANEFRAKTRKYFLHFAKRVSDDLNEIGFSYCTGGLMASNPKWTHSLSHWKRNYDQWIDRPEPQGVMNFSTFFDCRMIYGEVQLIKELQTHIHKKLEDPSEYFFALLAENAMQYEPPLNFFRGIKTISKDDQKVFNIKKSMTPIVDLVRVFALKHKIQKTNTGERLIALRELRVINQVDFDELMQAYYYLMSMRLKYQATQIIKDESQAHNYVSTDTLTKIEVVTIVEIFKVIENFQSRMKMNFTRNIFR